MGVDFSKFWPNAIVICISTLIVKTWIFFFWEIRLHLCVCFWSCYITLHNYCKLINKWITTLNLLPRPVMAFLFYPSRNPICYICRGVKKQKSVTILRYTTISHQLMALLRGFYKFSCFHMQFYIALLWDFEPFCWSLERCKQTDLSPTSLRLWDFLQLAGRRLRHMCTLEMRSVEPQLESQAVLMYSIKTWKAKAIWH